MFLLKELFLNKVNVDAIVEDLVDSTLNKLGDTVVNAASIGRDKDNYQFSLPSPDTYCRYTDEIKPLHQIFQSATAKAISVKVSGSELSRELNNEYNKMIKYGCMTADGAVAKDISKRLKNDGEAYVRFRLYFRAWLDQDVDKNYITIIKSKKSLRKMLLAFKDVNKLPGMSGLIKLQDYLNLSTVLYIETDYTDALGLLDEPVNHHSRYCTGNFTTDISYNNYVYPTLRTIDGDTKNEQDSEIKVVNHIIEFLVPSYGGDDDDKEIIDWDFISTKMKKQLLNTIKG